MSCTRCPESGDAFEINISITLPIGVEAYGAYALGVWLDRSVPVPARRFAKWSATGSLSMGALGQVAYHLLAAAHRAHAPWEVITIVSCLPVIAVGLAAGLMHMLHQEDTENFPSTAQDTGSEEFPRPLEAMTAGGHPSLSLFPEPLREQLPLPSAPSPHGGSHQAPRSRSWSRNRRAQAIYRMQPDIKGAELGRKIGVTPRHGQRVLNDVKATLNDVKQQNIIV